MSFGNLAIINFFWMNRSQLSLAKIKGFMLVGTYYVKPMFLWDLLDVAVFSVNSCKNLFVKIVQTIFMGAKACIYGHKF